MTIRLSLLASTFLFAAACGRSEPPASRTPASADPNAVVARFRGGQIQRGEIQAALEAQLASAPAPLSAEVRRAVVRKIVERRVRTEMLFEEAVAKGFSERPEVSVLQQEAEERVLAEDLLLSATASARASDASVVAEFDRRLAVARPEEARKFSHIFLRAARSDEAARRQASARMEEIRQALGAGTGFNKLAEQHSTSVKARDGGRIDWTLRSALPTSLSAVIFALDEGEVSDVISTKDGLHLFRLDGIRAATPIDAEQIRRSVRNELDAEARTAATLARRRLELDAKGRTPPSDPAERRQLENRLLAASRRAQAISAELEARVRSARRQALIDAYRESLMASFDTAPTEEEILRFHREHAEGALFLRDYQIDLLFFPQTGESAADVYAAGEAVVTALRDGRPFDDLLNGPARTNEKSCKVLRRVDLEALGKTSIRLRKAILSLEPGKVSPALYLDGPRTEVAPGRCTLEGRGVAFVRLRDIGTIAVDDARSTIEQALRKEKVAAGIGAIQARLIVDSGLEILLPEG